MNTTLSRPKKLDFLLLASGAASAVIAAAALTNTLPRWGISERTGLIMLVVAGMAMCARSPLGKMDVYGWANPRHLFGYAAGSLALAVAVTRFLGLSFLWVTSDRSAMITILLVMLAKTLVAASYPRRG